MKARPLSTAIVLGLFVLVGGTAARRQAGSTGSSPGAPSGLSQALDIVFARPFVVDEPFPHTWRAEQPLVEAGFLIVLEVDPAYVLPRETLEPVLYVGSETAERVNKGYPSGRVVALVPAPLTPAGAVSLDLSRTRIWFGTPELPERVDAARIAQELARAVAAGVEPPARERVLSARSAGGDLARFPDRTALERYAAERILEFAPDEAQNARSMLVPLVR